MTTKLTPEILDTIIQEIVDEQRATRILKEAKAEDIISVKLTRRKLKDLIKEVAEDTIDRVLLAQPLPTTPTSPPPPED